MRTKYYILSKFLVWCWFHIHGKNNIKGVSE